MKKFYASRTDRAGTLKHLGNALVFAPEDTPWTHDLLDTAGAEVVLGGEVELAQAARQTSREMIAEICGY